MAELETFTEPGRSWLVCPRLLELDARHGRHPGRWPAHWRQPAHPEHLEDPEGHLTNLFLFAPGCRPLNPSEWPHCPCGQALVHADLDHPGSEHDPQACPREGCA